MCNVERYNICIFCNSVFSFILNIILTNLNQENDNKHMDTNVIDFQEIKGVKQSLLCFDNFVLFNRSS